MSIDMNRAAVLLRVVHDCATIGPGLMNLTAEAMNELVVMDKEANEKQMKARAEADKKAADEAAAKAKAVEADKPMVTTTTDSTERKV